MSGFNTNILFTPDEKLYENFFKLYDYLITSDYYNSTDNVLKKTYKKRYDGIVKILKIANTGLDLYETKARKVQSVIDSECTIKCPLCLNLHVNKTIYPFNLVKGLLWRDYLIKPNTFPYFKIHFLIMPPYHVANRGVQNDVHKNKNIITDMLHFIKLMGTGSVFFNGMIGNSLEHLHFHYTDVFFPVTKFKQYKLKKKLKVFEEKIYFFEDDVNNCKNFIVVKGKKINSIVFNLLKYFASINLLYNLILNYKKLKYIVVIFVRQKNVVSNDFNLGASSLGGYTVVTDNNIELYKSNMNKFILDIEEYCMKTVIKFNINEIESIIE